MLIPTNQGITQQWLHMLCLMTYWLGEWCYASKALFWIYGKKLFTTNHDGKWELTIKLHC
jgi:hypothetical protein